MYKQSNRNTSRRPMNNGSRTTDRSRSNRQGTYSPRQAKTSAEMVEQSKPVVNVNMTLDDFKQQLNAWVETNKIPGKFQAWFTAESPADHCDWRLVKKFLGEHEKLVVDAPAKDMETPELVKRVAEQLKKDHLHIFSKALRQIWFRAVGDGRFAVLVQVNLKGRNSAHGYKTFVDFLERSCPEVISCHNIQCLPDGLFDPAGTIPMKVESKAAFGNDFMPIGDTGCYMHVLDWAPRMRDGWIGLPARIESAIHPNPEDCFFEFYSGSSFVSAMLASRFKRVDSMDRREFAMQSSKMNARNAADDNMRFHRGHVEQEFFNKFFSKKDNEGRWTLYLNLPGDESLPAGVDQALSQSRAERILLQTSNLEIAAREIKRLRREGYMLRKSIPLYLEPGSGKFELLSLFTPDRAGVLGLNPALKAKSRNVQRPQERVFRENRQEQPYFTTDIPSFKQRKG